GAQYGTTVVDPTDHAFSNITVFDGGGGGRVALNYTTSIDDDPSSPNYQTSQIDYKIFDMRTQAAIINPATTAPGQDWYQAGTHFDGDRLTGQNGNVLNTYYFVGADTNVPGPQHHLLGGT